MKTRFAKLLTTALMIGAAGLAPMATAEPLKNVSLAINDQLRVGYYWLYLPDTLGYWAEEGVEMEIATVSGASGALQQVIAGRVEFGQIGAVRVVQANAQEDLPAQMVFMNGVFAWKIGIPADSDIQSAADMAGRTLGVYDISANGNMFLAPYFEGAGIQMKDVTLVPVGFGGSALNALKNGDVDALYYWPSAFTTYEQQGNDFRYLSSPEWAHYPDFAVMALGDVIEDDPEMVIGVARSMAKAYLFASTNPECAVQSFWQAHPSAKPVDMSDEDALAQDVAILKAQLAEYDGAQDLFGENIGATTPEAMDLLQDLLFASGQLEKKGDPNSMMVSTSEYFDKVNDFDKAAIIAAAEACAL